jgi:xanthine dehydrogenase accessory factor
VSLIKNLAVVRGGGDIATGSIYRLAAVGIKILVLEIERPTVIRRTVAFAQAVYDGEATVEGMRAVRVASPGDAFKKSLAGQISVLVDPSGESIRELEPEIVIDAMLAKRNLGTTADMAKIVVGLGPGFTAGMDVHAVIETKRGHYLGSVIYKGCAEPNTGIPGMIGGYGAERVIHSPAAGTVRNIAAIGDIVKKDEIIARVGNTEVPSPLDGVLRGLIQDGILVPKGFKIGDVDPRGKIEYCYSISDKARAVAGGTLEAVLSLRCGFRPSVMAADFMVNCRKY